MGRPYRDQTVPLQAQPPVLTPVPPVEVAQAGGGWLARAAWILAAGWVAMVGTVLLAMSGAGAIGALSFVQVAALAFAAFMPSGLLAVAGFAAREGARAQAQARRLADAADRMMNPSPVAEAAARRLGVSIRSEIAALDRSMDEALGKLAAVETIIARQTQAVDQAAATAQHGAGHLVSGLERERGALMQISADLETNATRLGESVLRQAQMVASAAREAEGQLKAADHVLEGRLHAFGSAAQLIGDRTGMLTHAAAATADSTHRLEGALAGALDMLAQATNLTEAARQSTEAATQAANATAGAVRDTTNRAIDDARRAADLIRSEAQNIEREATLALDRLREAAGAARDAAVDAREATGAPAPPKRTGAHIFSFIPGNKDRSSRADARRQFEQLQVARGAAVPPANARARAFAEQFGPRIQARGALEDRVTAERSNSERWNWRELLRAVDPETAHTQAREPAGRPRVNATPNSYEPPPPMRRAAPAYPAAPAAMRPLDAPEPMAPVKPRTQPQQVFSLQASMPAVAPRRAETLFERPLVAPGRTAQMLDTLGIRVGEIFSNAALDRIAARARNGTQARRRAVREAAPDAVLRLSERFDNDPRAREEASRFLDAEGPRLADLLGRGRASMSAESTRTFLLIDAASS